MGRISSEAFRKALSLAFSQAADLALWATFAACPKMPPSMLPAPSRALVAALSSKVSNSVRYPLPQRSQRNSNRKPLPVLGSP